MQLVKLRLLLIVSAFCFSSVWAEYPVAGVEPSARPEGAPVIEKAKKDAGWYTHALTGLSEPYPASFRFLEHQGNWYTPFIRPGMTGRYDIRQWHGHDSE